MINYCTCTEEYCNKCIPIDCRECEKCEGGKEARLMECDYDPWYEYNVEDDLEY